MKSGPATESEKIGWGFQCSRCDLPCFLRNKRFWGKYAIPVIRQFHREQQPVNSLKIKTVLRRAINFVLARPELRYRLVTLIGKFPCLDRYLRSIACGLDPAPVDSRPYPSMSPQPVGMEEKPGTQGVSENLPLRARHIYQEMLSALSVDNLEGDR